MLERDVLVVGAGPAGLAASIEAAKAGADVLLVDLNMKPGGQLFKQIHKFFGSSAHRSGTRGFDIGKMLLDEAEKAGVEIWLQSTVIGAFPGNLIAIEKGIDGGEKEVITIKSKKVTFIIKGKTYSAKTNKKGMQRWNFMSQKQL